MVVSSVLPGGAGDDGQYAARREARKSHGAECQGRRLRGTVLRRGRLAWRLRRTLAKGGNLDVQVGRSVRDPDRRSPGVKARRRGLDDVIPRVERDGGFESDAREL